VFVGAGVELRVEQVVGPVWVNADATRLAQVLGNLLQNAVKFTPRGGAVAVHVSRAQGLATIQVKDTGVGMDPATIDRMFEPFAQAEQTLARTMGGLGLGLALVKGLVEMHDGRVTANSEGIGKGTEVVVQLPAEGSGEMPAAEATGTTRTDARRILVVEDNDDSAQTLADLLEMYGHEVHIARDGRSGIALAHELRPDVLLCDIGLPDVDGYEVARSVRRDDTLARTRLVALSGYAQPEDVERSREAGFEAHLAKPPKVDRLVALIAGT
jgi:CheY-like chemotaxis protein